jgi:U11/U12 small nuclear ribonucleoprotein 35 kDa protein
MELSYTDKLSKIYKYNYECAYNYGFYDPLMAGSIDGTDEKPHDHGIVRALNNSNYKPKNLDKQSTNPDKSLFVGRVNYKTSEDKLKQTFEKFGTIRNIRLVRDIVTGLSKGYAFIEFKHRSDCKKAYHESFKNKLIIDNREILVDYEHDRNLPGWIPRRLGGGLGGFKESGQLRFGGRYKPFGRVSRTSLSKKY